MGYKIDESEQSRLLSKLENIDTKPMVECIQRTSPPGPLSES